MEVSIISWRVCFESLNNQRPGTLELWLCRWLFSNEGVMLADQFRTEELATRQNDYQKVFAIA